MIGMAEGVSSAEDSMDEDSDLSRMRTATGHKKRPDDDSNLGRTRTATGHRKRRGKKNWQPNDFGIFLSLFLLHIIHVPFHIHHQLTERMFILFAYSFFIITHLSNSYIAAWLRCEACVCEVVVVAVVIVVVAVLLQLYRICL